MTIEQLLRSLEDKILIIKKRLYFLQDYEKELTRLTRGKPFNLANDIVHRLLWDSYEMLIIELASLYRGMCQPGGFFGQLKIHAAKFKRTSHRKIEVSEPDISGAPNTMSDGDRKRISREIKTDIQKRISKGINERLAELFPELDTSTGQSANHDHIEKLKDTFWKMNEEMVNDRDAFRAHKYEFKDHRLPEDIEPLALKAIEVHFDRLERLINGIRSVTTQSTFMYCDMNQASSEETARDLADIVTIGSINRIFNKFDIPLALENVAGVPKYYYLIRTEFYEKVLPKPGSSH